MSNEKKIIFISMPDVEYTEFREIVEDLETKISEYYQQKYVLVFINTCFEPVNKKEVKQLLEETLEKLEERINIDE
jgi:hypothetical protein